MDEAEPTPPGGFPRGKGLAVLVGLVILGMGTPAFLQWSVPRLEAERERVRTSMPNEAEGLLASWFRFGQPQIHQALVTARYSARQPWYVSHVVVPTDPEAAPEVWGIDFSDLDYEEVIELDGLTVAVVLEEPSLLAREELAGTRSQGVPRFAPDEEVDGADLSRRRLEVYFEKLAAALARDVEGARFVVQVGDSRTEEEE